MGSNRAGTGPVRTDWRRPHVHTADPGGTAVTLCLCVVCVWSSQNHIFNIPHSLSSLSRQLGFVKLSCDPNTHKSWSDWLFLPEHIFHIKTKYWYCSQHTHTHDSVSLSQWLVIKSTSGHKDGFKLSSAPSLKKSKRLFLLAIIGPRQLNNAFPSRPVTSRQSGSLAERGRSNCLYIWHVI